jgi:hypothetical protein
MGRAGRARDERDHGWGYTTKDTSLQQTSMMLSHPWHAARHRTSSGGGTWAHASLWNSPDNLSTAPRSPRFRRAVLSQLEKLIGGCFQGFLYTREQDAGGKGCVFLWPHHPATHWSTPPPLLAHPRAPDPHRHPNTGGTSSRTLQKPHSAVHKSTLDQACQNQQASFPPPPHGREP